MVGIQIASMETDRIHYSITLPCYNEALNIPNLFERFRQVLCNRCDIEVIFVDNGSTDHSHEILERECSREENRFAKAVKVDVNQGYGFGILSGLNVARGEWLGWTHADFQTDPQDIIRAIETIEAQNKPVTLLLKGKRIERNPLDTFFTVGMSLISTLVLSSKLSDVNAQPKFFHRSFFDKIVNDAPLDFSLDLYLLYKANQLELKTVELPVSFEKRIHGEAKGGGTLRGKLKLIKRTCIYILELRKNLA